MTAETQTDRAVEPVYAFNPHGGVALLHEGPLAARLTRDGEETIHDGEGRVVFQLAPEPAVQWEVVSPESGAAGAHGSPAIMDLPLINDYLAAFNTAREYRRERGKVDSPAERQAIERIRGCLHSSNRTTDVLVCVDRGKGIDGDALRALYNTGDTTKRTGRGSVGLGHLTAFAASDLRYVLYAGCDGEGGETFGGHAILATSSADGVQRDAHGYVRGPRERRDTPASQASGSPRVPALVRAWLPSARESGSAVAILGYGPTSRVKEGVFEESVLEAAAKSFVVAVHLGQLTVDCRVRGEVSASLGVTAKSASRARQILQRSARVAGVFREDGGVPASPAAEQAAVAPRRPTRASGRAGGPPAAPPPPAEVAAPRRRHQLIGAIWETLPVESEFPEPQRSDWLRMLEIALNLVYGTTRRDSDGSEH